MGPLWGRVSTPLPLSSPHTRRTSWHTPNLSKSKSIINIPLLCGSSVPEQLPRRLPNPEEAPSDPAAHGPFRNRTGASRVVHALPTPRAACSGRMMKLPSKTILSSARKGWKWLDLLGPKNKTKPQQFKMAAGAATPAQVRVAAFHWQTASLTSSRLLGFRFGAGTCRAPMDLHPHKLGVNSRLVFLSYQKIPAPGGHTRSCCPTLLLFDLPAIKKHKGVAVQPSGSPLFSLGAGSGWLGGAREAAEKSSGHFGLWLLIKLGSL